MIDVKIQLLPGGIIPTRAHENDAGWDLYSCIDVVIEGNNGRVLIPVGFKMELPDGWEAQIRPRSGLALKYGITVTNAPGTIDAGYRNEIQVILQNTNTCEYIVRTGDRIAQMVIKEVPQVRLIKVDELADSERGENGYGSSGK